MPGTRMPKAEIMANVHSRVHLCREAAVVRVTGGQDRLVCRGEGERYDLYIGDNRLLDARVYNISTLSPTIMAGYGEGAMDEATAAAVSDALNAPYQGMEAAVQAMTPLLGLLRPGLYLVGDFELLPVIREWSMPEHCLNGKRCSMITATDTGMYGDRADAPMYLYPTQRAALLNPERIDAYMAMLQEMTPWRAPRAVSLYLRGSLSLLLDGHHKAAAAAALGRRVPTLVICMLREQETLETAIERGTALELRHGRWDYEQDERSSSVSSMSIADEQLQPICYAEAYNWRYARSRLPEPQQLREEQPWGEVPQAYCTQLKAYPYASEMQHGTEIPPDRIKAVMRRARTMRFEDCAGNIGLGLSCYARLFPDSPLLTESDRAWLQSLDQVREAEHEIRRQRMRERIERMQKK
ncbi:MAG: hypothetical protein J6K32_11950 [Clostridia bacterium]|nr:hypothetical protein [Clostridia bacterium]